MSRGHFLTGCFDHREDSVMGRGAGAGGAEIPGAKDTEESIRKISSFNCYSADGVQCLRVDSC